MGRPRDRGKRDSTGGTMAADIWTIRLIAMTCAILVGAVAGLVLSGPEPESPTAQAAAIPAPQPAPAAPRKPAVLRTISQTARETAPLPEPEPLKAAPDAQEVASITPAPVDPAPPAASTEWTLAPNAEEPQEIVLAPTTAPDGTRLWPGRTNEAVNLRARPDNGAAVLTIVPENAALLSEKDCPYWCSVEYDGHRGYIYKTFIRVSRN